jgi:hypothetical protein
MTEEQEMKLQLVAIAVLSQEVERAPPGNRGSRLEALHAAIQSAMPLLRLHAHDIMETP